MDYKTISESLDRILTEAKYTDMRAIKTALNTVKRLSRKHPDKVKQISEIEKRARLRGYFTKGDIKEINNLTKVLRGDSRIQQLRKATANRIKKDPQFKDFARKNIKTTREVMKDLPVS